MPTKQPMFVTFSSLPFEILLQIAETGPGALSQMRLLSRSIKEYTDTCIDKYKERWSVVENKHSVVFTTCINMKLSVPDDTHLPAYDAMKRDRIRKNYRVCDIALQTFQNGRFKVLTVVNDKEKFEISYLDGLKHGKYIHSTNRKRVECHFDMNQLHGSYKEWRFGHLTKSFNYDKNKLCGKCFQWEKCSTPTKTPKLKYQCYYFQGKLDGLFKEWCSGCLIKEIYYGCGIPQHCKIMDSWGTLVSQSTYHNDKLHGDIYLFSAHKMDISGHFQTLHNTFVEKAHFVDGKIDGIHSIVDSFTGDTREYFYNNGVYIKTLKGKIRDKPREWSFYKFQLGKDYLCPKIRQPNNIKHLFQTFTEHDSADIEFFVKNSAIFNDPPAENFFLVLSEGTATIENTRQKLFSQVH